MYTSNKESLFYKESENERHSFILIPRERNQEQWEAGGELGRMGRVSVREEERVLEADRGEGCTTR